MADHTLTDEDIGALKLALSRVLVEGKKTSEGVDRATDDSALYDPVHDSLAGERRRAERLMELLEAADEVVLHLPD